MVKTPLTVAILFTMRCNVDCPHCGFACSPRKTEDASLEMITSFCLEAQQFALENTRPLKVEITGGEPFLRYRDLLRFGERLNAAADGVTYSCMTNGFWATNVSKAKEMLEPLRQSGCCRIGLSVDQYHMEKVGLDRMRNAVEALIDLRMEFGFKFTRMKNRRSLFECLAEFGDILDNASEFVFKVHSFNCVPVGRASELSEAHFHRRPELPGTSCALDTAMLTPDGRVLVCCGSFDFASSLVLGKYPDKTVQQLMAAFEERDLYRVLQADGPKYFAQALDSEGFGISQRSYTHVCDLCRHVFADVPGDEKKTRVIGDAVRRWREEHDRMETKVIPLLEGFLGADQAAPGEHGQWRRSR